MQKRMVTWAEAKFYIPRLAVGGFLYAIMIAGSAAAIGASGGIAVQMHFDDLLYSSMGGHGETPGWATGAAGALASTPAAIAAYLMFSAMNKKIEGNDD